MKRKQLLRLVKNPTPRVLVGSGAIRIPALRSQNGVASGENNLRLVARNHEAHGYPLHDLANHLSERERLLGKNLAAFCGFIGKAHEQPSFLNLRVKRAIQGSATCARHLGSLGRTRELREAFRLALLALYSVVKDQAGSFSLGCCRLHSFWQ